MIVVGGEWIAMDMDMRGGGGGLFCGMFEVCVSFWEYFVCVCYIFLGG